MFSSLVCAVVNVHFVSMSYSVGEEEGNVEVCARMVGLNVKDVVVTVSTNEGTAKCTWAIICYIQVWEITVYS